MQFLNKIMTVVMGMTLAVALLPDAAPVMAGAGVVMLPRLGRP